MGFVKVSVINFRSSSYAVEELNILIEIFGKRYRNSY